MTAAAAQAPPLSTSQDKRRVFLVDDHPLVREWMGTLIAGQEDLVIAGEAAEAPVALDEIVAARPDVAVVDLSLAKGSGLDLIKSIRAACPETAVLVLSMHEEPTYVERALRSGAMGYVIKRETTKNIITVIRSVLDGQLFLSDQFAQLMARRMVIAPGTENPVESLSDRELEVFEKIGEGLEIKRVADDLNLSHKTVQVYTARIREKLGLGSGQELLREAVLWRERQTNPKSR